MTGDGERHLRLRAFIGRSFLPSDERVWTEIREVLDALAPLGFVYEDAKEAQPKAVSEKVRGGIDRNDVYIAISFDALELSGDDSKVYTARRSDW